MRKKTKKKSTKKRQVGSEDELLALLNELRATREATLRASALEKKVNERRKREREKSIIDLARLKDDTLVAFTFKMKTKTREEFRDLLDSIRNQHDQRKTYVVLMDEAILLLKQQYEKLGVTVKPRSLEVRKSEFEKAASMQLGKLEASVKKIQTDELIQYLGQNQIDQGYEVRESKGHNKETKKR